MASKQSQTWSALSSLHGRQRGELLVRSIVGNHGPHPLVPPEFPDHLELAFHGPRDTAELGGDLLGRVALHLPDGDGAQDRVAEPIEQPLGFLGELEGEVRSGLAVDELRPFGLKAAGLRRPFGDLRTPGPPRLTRRSCRSRSIALCDVRAIRSGQRLSPSWTCGNCPSRAPRQKLLNALERHILFIGRSPRRSLELDPRQLDHPSVINIPKLSRRLRVASLELPEPEHDRIISIHNNATIPFRWYSPSCCRLSPDRPTNTANTIPFPGKKPRTPVGETTHFDETD